MAGGGSSASLGSASLKQYHRLLLRCLFHGSAESFSILNPLDVKGYYLGVCIIGKIFEQIVLVDVASVAVAYDLAEPTAPHRCLPDKKDGIAATLTDDSYRAAFFGKSRTEGQARLRAVNAHTVRAENSYALSAGNFHQFRFQLYSLFFTGLTKARCTEVNCLNALFGTFLHEPGSNLSINQADYVIDVARHIFETGINLVTFNLPSLGIDKIERTVDPDLQGAL